MKKGYENYTTPDTGWEKGIGILLVASADAGKRSEAMDGGDCPMLL